MSSYSIRVNRFNHEGGTKFYDIFTFEGPNANSIVITRYGPINGTSAQKKCNIKITIKRYMSNYVNKIIEDKTSKGYRSETALEWLDRPENRIPVIFDANDDLKPFLEFMRTQHSYAYDLQTIFGMKNYKILFESFQNASSDDTVEFVPVQEIQRSALWGSW